MTNSVSQRISNSFCIMCEEINIPAGEFLIHIQLVSSLFLPFLVLEYFTSLQSGHDTPLTSRNRTADRHFLLLLLWRECESIVSSSCNNSIQNNKLRIEYANKPRHNSFVGSSDAGVGGDALPEREVKKLRSGLLRQYLYFFTSKTTKLSTW